MQNLLPLQSSHIFGGFSLLFHKSTQLLSSRFLFSWSPLKSIHWGRALCVFFFPWENDARMLNRAVAAVLAPCVIPVALLWPRRRARLQAVSLQEGLTFMTAGSSLIYYEKYQGNNQNCTKSIFKFLYCLFIWVSEIRRHSSAALAKAFQLDEHPWLTSLWHFEAAWSYFQKLHRVHQSPLGYLILHILIFWDCCVWINFPVFTLISYNWILAGMCFTNMVKLVKLFFKCTVELWKLQMQLIVLH